MEKINGVSKKEKFRIRYYDYNKSFITLEKKAKIDKLCCKTSEVISEEQVNKILDGDIQWMLDCEKPLPMIIMTATPISLTMPKQT